MWRCRYARVKMPLGTERTSFYELFAIPSHLFRSLQHVQEMHYIADDLEQHAWYVEMVSDTVAVLEKYLAAWAALEDAVENVD